MNTAVSTRPLPSGSSLKATAIWLHTAFSFSLFLLGGVVILHLNFWQLPCLFLLLGISTGWTRPRLGLCVFLFLLPSINATPDLFWNGYPYNYLAVSLFYLAGLAVASILKDGWFPVNRKIFRCYGYFLGILFLSALFLFLRWSNLTLPGRAFMADTPVEPGGSRLWFALIFPVVTLALFSISPFIYLLFNRLKLKGEEIFRWLGPGYLVSLGLALGQALWGMDFLTQKKWLTKSVPQVNGGGSDFNAFGLLSALIFLYFALRLLRKVQVFPFLMALCALTGIFLSGCRSAFLVIPVWLGALLTTRRIRPLLKITGILILLVLLVLVGSTLKQRLYRSFHTFMDFFAGNDGMDSLNRLSSGRITMIQKSLQMVRTQPLTGGGTGNYLFFLKKLNYRDQALEDLPLNHYLLILAENGLAGLVLFVLFLIGIYRALPHPRDRNFHFLFSFFLLALALNNFLWFPELAVLFWVIIYLGIPSRTGLHPRAKKIRPLWIVATLLILAGSHLVTHWTLHPGTWSRQADTRYDYGFWYPETGPAGETWRWTRGRSGIYIYLDHQGESDLYRLFCGAPLADLPGRRQTVDVYWRGELYRRVTFSENRGESFRITDPDHREGFLEFRVHPVFNLKEMNLSPESRNLGIQFSVMEPEEE